MEESTCIPRKYSASPRKQFFFFISQFTSIIFPDAVDMIILWDELFHLPTILILSQQSPKMGLDFEFLYCFLWFSFSNGLFPPWTSWLDEVSSTTDMSLCLILMALLKPIEND